jgi:hypothetical protein
MGRLIGQFEGLIQSSFVENNDCLPTFLPTSEWKPPHTTRHIDLMRTARGHTIREELKAVDYDTSKFIEAFTQNDNLTPEQLLAILTESVEGLSGVSVQIEAELEDSQTVAQTSELEMYHILEVQVEKLCKIENDVETVLVKFDEASGGAIRLGERLTTTELERKKIEFASELMSYIQHFQNIEPKSFLGQLQSCRHDIELKSRLPIELRRKDWGEISKVGDGSIS